MIDYRRKLRGVRCRPSTIGGRSFNEEMESDRGRAVNSAALRRLQQKTQVFPLETNAAVRSRLTHSLEVQQVGRHIAGTILARIRAAGKLESFHLCGYEEGFISAVETACLLHDVGNPPFGHFGEKAINLWAERVIAPRFGERFPAAGSASPILRDLLNFEGNAQGLRTLHQLQSLNLTCTQLASLVKYPRCAAEPAPAASDPLAMLKKKPGYYLSEQPMIDILSRELDLPPGSRFPLTFIMEAADDISYCIADIEDAVDKGILTIARLHELIATTWRELAAESPEIIADNWFPGVSEEALACWESERFNREHAYLLLLRTRFINSLAACAADRYLANHEAIFTGSFTESLLDGSNCCHFATETLRRIAFDHVFATPEVENLELKGYAVISGLLNIYSPLIDLGCDQFCDLADSGSLHGHPIESRLFHKLPRKMVECWDRSVAEHRNSGDFPLWEFYHRCRLLMDYIGGMSDGFALEQYRHLAAIS